MSVRSGARREEDVRQRLLALDVAGGMLVYIPSGDAPPALLAASTSQALPDEMVVRASDADARYIVAFTGTTDGAYYVWEVRFVGEHGVEVVAQLEAIRAHGLSNGAADTCTYRVTPVRYIDGEGATPPLAGLS